MNPWMNNKEQDKEDYPPHIPVVKSKSDSSKSDQVCVRHKNLLSSRPKGTNFLFLLIYLNKLKLSSRNKNLARER